MKCTRSSVECILRAGCKSLRPVELLQEGRQAVSSCRVCRRLLPCRELPPCGSPVPPAASVTGNLPFPGHRAFSSWWKSTSVSLHLWSMTWSISRVETTLWVALILLKGQRNRVKVKILVEHELRISWLAAAWLFQSTCLSFYLFSVSPNLGKSCAGIVLEYVHFEVEKLLSSEEMWRSEKQLLCLMVFTLRSSGALRTPITNLAWAED